MSHSLVAGQWAVVLAGGDGTRLQEFTREISGAPVPKQYCRILGERSLLEATLARSQHFAPLHRTMVVVNCDHLPLACEHLAGVPHGNVLVQPCNRDTGPGMLFALLHLAQREPGATVAVLPSDHFVDDDRAFMAHVARAARIVARLPEKVAVLGIRPDRLELGYGYITPAKAVGAWTGPPVAFHVAAFHEKPSSAEAAQKLRNAGGLWNSFVMVFRLAHLLELVQAVAPKDFERMSRFLRDANGLAGLYQELRAWNFSREVLTRVAEHLIVVPLDDVYWSDWGTRESVEHTLTVLNRPPPWRAAGSRKPVRSNSGNSVGLRGENRDGRYNAGRAERIHRTDERRAGGSQG